MSLDPDKEKRRQTGLFRRAGRKGVEDGIANFIAMTIQYGPILLVLFMIVVAGGFVLTGGNILGIFQFSRPESQQTITIGNQPTATVQAFSTAIPTSTSVPTEVQIQVMPTNDLGQQQQGLTYSNGCSDLNGIAKGVYQLDYTYGDGLMDTPYGDGETSVGYGSGHSLLLYNDGSIEIWVDSGYGAVYETGFYLSSIPSYTWVNVHKFDNVGVGAYGMCYDDYNVYIALVPYNFY